MNLRNPHSILAVFETRPEDVSKIILPRGNLEPAWEKVRSSAERSGAIIDTVQFNKPSGKRPQERDGRSGAAEALVKERASQPLEKFFTETSETNGKYGLWLALDCIQDPRNIGAIFRTAAFFGVRGIILTDDRSAPLSGTAYDAASGGLEYVPFCVLTNLARALEMAKEKDIWILGASEHRGDDFRKIPRDRSWLLVLGNEEKGLRRLTEENCDMMCKIPALGAGVGSLNVSVAGGVLISYLQ